ncbi:MAG: hypothetical protein LBK06_04965 [Planctomycetaceae bacterium]|nr:hypothetical protein [Planctomycetaceae bacterium]
MNTAAQQRGAVVQGRSLSPYRLRYCFIVRFVFLSCQRKNFFDRAIIFTTFIKSSTKLNGGEL